MKTAHRNAARAKREQTPKFWLPAAPESLRTTGKVACLDLIDRFTSGKATADDMWDWIETGFMASHMVHLLATQEAVEFTDEAMAAVAEQLSTFANVTGRHRRTGRVGFNSAELLAARAAAEVICGLLDMDRHGIAERAAHWGQEQAHILRRRFGT